MSAFAFAFASPFAQRPALGEPFAFAQRSALSALFAVAQRPPLGAPFAFAQRCAPSASFAVAQGPAVAAFARRPRLGAD